MPRAPKRATSADVARAAGVSRTTVSFVLNDKPGLSIPEETRRRVLDSARDLDYRPHASARALRAGHSDIVLLSVPDQPLEHSISRIIEEFAAAFASHGLTMVSRIEEGRARPAADVCAAINAAAVVGLHPFDDDTEQALRRVGAMAVLSSSEAENLAQLRQLGRLQARHLIARGHRRLGYALPANPLLRQASAEVLDAAGSACAEAGLPGPVAMTTPVDLPAAADAVRRWREQPVTGICAYNDAEALAVLGGLHALGLLAPDDLAVIGAGDTPAARVSVPPLTTVAYDYRQIAAGTAAAIAGILRGKPLSDGQPMPPDIVPTIVQRSST